MKKTYQQLKSELDEIIVKLEDPDIDIDEALTLHQKAGALTRDLDQYLSQREQKFKKIKP